MFEKLKKADVAKIPLMKALIASFEELQSVLEQDKNNKRNYNEQLNAAVKLAEELVIANVGSPDEKTISEELQEDIKLLIQSNLYVCHLLNPTPVGNTKNENIKIIEHEVTIIDFTNGKELETLAKQLDSKIQHYQDKYDSKTNAMNITRAVAILLLALTALAVLIALTMIAAPVAAIAGAVGVVAAITVPVCISGEFPITPLDRKNSFRFFLQKENHKILEAHYKTQDYIKEHVFRSRV